jgi:BirA family transcriptional regulator, biotin operon repressor / biotin---[acetyl-CoA-carboxylase] ligase
MFTEQLLREGLKARVFGGKIYTFDTIDSTSNCARALAGCFAPEGTIVISEQQTAGRGRLGRTWQASPGENLTFSIILRPALRPEAVNLLPLYVAVSVAQASQQVAQTKVECKWPNDLMVNGKKFGGILLEGSVKQNELEYVVVGIGLNVNQTSFSPELQEKATSLRLASGKAINREILFREILLRLETDYQNLKTTGFQSVLPSWLSFSSMNGKQISVEQNGSVLSGTVKGLSPDGGLILHADGAERVLFAGDVTIVGFDRGIGIRAPGH